MGSTPPLKNKKTNTQTQKDTKAKSGFSRSRQIPHNQKQGTKLNSEQHV